MKSPFLITLFLLFWLTHSGCNTFQELATLQKPTASLSDYKIEGLSLDKADLIFDLKIQNPNPVAINIENYTYDFLIENESFLQGSQNSKTTIDASDENIIQIPVTLAFTEVIESIRTVVNNDEISYSFNAVIGTQVPILGLVELPISQKGSIPKVKIPSISIASFKIENLSFSKAKLLVGMEIQNNNQFGIDLINLNYSIDIDGLNVVDGNINEGIEIARKETSFIEIPIEFNLLQLGMAAYQMLSSNNPIEYSINGNSNLGVDLPYFNASAFDFNKNGTINISN